MTSSNAPVIDRAIGYLFPRWGAERAYFRAAGRAIQGSYRGAARTRTDTAWSSTYQGVRNRERLNRESFRQMRARARQLEQDNVLAAATLDRAVENVVGTGLRVRATSSDPDFNAAVNAQWRRWTNGKTADIRHAHTFGSLQRLFYRAKLRDGDAGILLTEEKDAAGVPHPRLQVIEGEHIDTPTRLSGDRRVIDGLELTANNAAAAYWLRTEDENGNDLPEGLRVKARDFIYLCRPALYSSFRGETAFNGGWVLFDQIVGYLEAAVMTSRVGAAQALLIKKRNPGNAIAQLGTTTNGAGVQQPNFTIEPGMAHYLAPDEDVQAFNPSQPQQNLPDAVAAFTRFIGLRFGLTIEQLLLDFSRANYSSGRAARLQAEATATLEQEDFAATFLARVYPWAVAKWVKNGTVKAPAPADAYAFEWIPQGRPWVDPTKEIDAAAKAIALGLDSRSNIAMERGYDFRELVQRNQEDVKLLADAGLPTDPMAKVTDTPPAADPTQPTQPEGQPNAA